ncbi:MAG: PHB depolymerase family esterase [Myxococcota bacterium]
MKSASPASRKLEICDRFGLEQQLHPIACPEPPKKAAPHVRRPEEAAQVGDKVRGPKVQVRAAEVLDALHALELAEASEPTLRASLSRQPFPKGKDAQLAWAIAHADHIQSLSDPLWLTAKNDAAPAMVAYVRGVLAARKMGVVLTADLEAQIRTEQLAVYKEIATKPGLFDTLESAPFPAEAGPRVRWAIGVLVSSWDPSNHPAVKASPIARAFVDLVAGVLAKHTNNESEVLVRSARHTITVDGDTRVYALHTPPGPRPPSGWPTVVFFHGSYGGYAPEQSPDYQALTAVADAQGYQVVFPVGTPQDRADLIRTGRGMLNWDPVGAGPGQKNDRFVMSLLASLKKSGQLDGDRTFIAGHSQGGFYVSNLIASYPSAFAGAAIFGAGAGSVASRSNFGVLSRKTPLFMRTGENDIHLPMAESLAMKLDHEGYGHALFFEKTPQRAHEILEEDYQAMFAHFQGMKSPFHSELGSLDGNKAEVEPGSQAFLPSISLVDPPAILKADAKALATMKALANTPLCDLDGDPGRLSSNEWRIALYYLDTFPEEMRGAIADLRRYFVVVPPPEDARFDLAKLPEPVTSDPAAMTALAYIRRTSALDLDGYPAIVSERELSAAERYKKQLPWDIQRGLDALRKYAPKSAV